MTILSVAVENVAGDALGNGPLSTVTELTVRQRLDQIGAVDFEMPATDERTVLFVPNTSRYVRAHAVRAGVRVQVAYGLVKERSTGTDGRIKLSGPSVEGELQHYHVGKLVLEDGSNPGEPMPAADVMAEIMAFAPGWTSTGTPSQDVYFKFGDENIVAALNKIADITGDHWRLSSTVDRQIEILPTTGSGFVPVASGLTATDRGGGDNDDLCLIVGELQEVADAHERITRIVLRGGGNGDAQLYINGTDRFSATTTPGDYTSGDFTIHIDADPDQSYIAYDPAEADGTIIEGVETFRDIAPLDDSAADELSARNSLVDAGLVRLRQRAVEQRSYRFRVTKVRKPLIVGTSIVVKSRHYKDGYGWLLINEALLLLEVAPSYSAEDGEPVYTLQTTQIAVDRWPVSEPAKQAKIAKAVASLTSHVQVAERATSASAITPTTAATPILADYNTAVAHSIAHATPTIVDYGSVVTDTASAVTVGASWHFTAPVAGSYDVSAAVMFDTTATWALGEVAWLAVYKNGSIYRYLERKDNLSTATVWMQLSGATSVPLVAGDTLDIRVNQASGGALPLIANAAYNYVTIARRV